MNAKRRTIAFVINSLAGGGAERVLVNLLGYMEQELADYDVHLVLLDDEPEWQSAPDWVEKHVLDAKGSMLKSVVLLARTLKKISPDVTLSFLNRGNCANIFAGRLFGFPCVISERVHTSSHFPSNLSGTINKMVVRLTYPWATGVVSVSDGIRQDLVNNFGVSDDRIKVIHNPIDIDALHEKAKQAPAIDLPKTFILGVGRLVPNKNFALLINAYQNSGIKDPLVILGEGDLRDELEALIEKLSLGERVRLAGFVENPYPIMKRAKFMASSSNAEGFPNSLIESMTLGCPVVATDCESGPREILGADPNSKCTDAVQAEYGILTPMNDVVSLTEAMKLMAKPATRKAYSEAGRRRAEDYSVASSVKAYLNAVLGNIQDD